MNYLLSLVPSVTHLGIAGYWVVLMISLLESLAVVGSIIPGTVLLVLAGFLSSQGYLDIGDLIWFVAVGAILGDGISYYLGTKGTGFFQEKNLVFKASHLEAGKKFFVNHGSKSVFLGRFVGPLRPIIPFVAGLSGMNLKKFLAWNILSAVVWSAAVLLIGYFFGNAFGVIQLWSTRIEYASGIIILFFALLYGVKFIIIKHGRRVADFIRSLFSSIGSAIHENPDIQKLIKSHPRLVTFFKQRLDRGSLSGLPLTLIFISLVYIIFLFFGVVNAVVTSNTVVSADVRIANLLAYFRDPQLAKAFLWITLLGKSQIVIGIPIMLSIILWLWKKRDYIVYLWLAVVSDELFTVLGKYAVHRTRPINPVYLEHSFSFPSGHAMIAVVLYGFIGYILIRHSQSWRLKVNTFFICLTIILAIGFSRLYLGVHYVSDVWGGYLLGVLILTTVIALREWKYAGQGEPMEKPVSARIKMITAALIVANIIFYIGFASQYRPPRIEPSATNFKTVDTNIDTYFTDQKISKYSETILGAPQEPLGFIFLATDDESLIKNFTATGWFLSDKSDFNSITRAIQAAFLNKEYLNAPVTPSFWNATVNDFSFEMPTSAHTIRERHHIRIWKTNIKHNGKIVYVGTASLDIGIKWFVTHRINPDIDTEKTFVKKSLESDGGIINSEETQFVDPVLGKNFNSDTFFTNGKLFILELRDL